MATRMLCPHCATPLLSGYGRSVDRGQATVRRRDCPRCGARYDTREEIVRTNRKPVKERGVEPLAALLDGSVDVKTVPA